MALIFRDQKGAPLTSDEVDGNFRELLTRIELLEKTPALAESIGKIEQKGDRVEVIGTNGTSFGAYKIPLLMYRLRGNWCPKTSYATADVITRQAQAWVCQQPHVSGEKFEPQEWNLLLEVPTTGYLETYKKLPSCTPGAIVLFENETQMTLVYGTVNGWVSVQNQSLDTMPHAQ